VDKKTAGVGREKLFAILFSIGVLQYDSDAIKLKCSTEFQQVI
jgi:hypothetical protein